MDEKIKIAFDNVHAEEKLKSRTKEFVAQRTNGYSRAKNTYYKRLIPAMACFVLVILGGYWLYFTPVVAISVDINPSMELGVNRFDKVVSINGYNEDGEKLADSLDIKYLDYTEAVRQIIESDTVSVLLSNDGILTLGVIGSDDSRSEAVLKELESCTAGKTNTYCYCADRDELSEAHNVGLSYGKYRAYLELQALDPNITPEEVQQMTMREIRDLIDKMSAGNSEDYNSENKNDSDSGNGMGQGNGSGAGKQNMLSPE